MEETGRQKTASRQSPTNNTGATTTTGGVTPAKKSVPLESFVGKSIKIKTASNEEVEGLIYTYDKITNCIVIDILFYYITANLFI
jgi:hypothetical protein